MLTRIRETLSLLPRVVLALEQVGTVAQDLGRLADAAERLSGMAADLERLTTAARELSRLADAAETLPQVSADLERLGKAAPSIQILAESASELGSAVIALNATVSPLQGTTERLGRLVDRLPQRRAQGGAPSI
ncbi:hypothetical protein GCM10027589_56180 [Actinocorallia lasiicapitis]